MPRLKAVMLLHACGRLLPRRHGALCAGPTVFPRAYTIRLCEHTGCYRIVWQRDTNAAINLLLIMRSWLFGMAKPAAYQRPQERQQGAAHAQQQ